MSKLLALGGSVSKVTTQIGLIYQALIVDLSLQSVWIDQSAEILGLFRRVHVRANDPADFFGRVATPSTTSCQQTFRWSWGIHGATRRKEVVLVDTVVHASEVNLEVVLQIPFPFLTVLALPRSVDTVRHIRGATPSNPKTTRCLASTNKN